MRCLAYIKDLATSLRDLPVDRSLHSRDREIAAPGGGQRDALISGFEVGEGIEGRWIWSAGKGCGARRLNRPISISPLETWCEFQSDGDTCDSDRHIERCWCGAPKVDRPSDHCSLRWLSLERAEGNELADSIRQRCCDDLGLTPYGCETAPLGPCCRCFTSCFSPCRVEVRVIRDPGPLGICDGAQ